MKQKELKEFKARWNRVRAWEKKESRNLSATARLRQLSSLVGTAIAMGVVLKEDKEKVETRERWVLLKKSRNEKCT